MSNLSPRSAVLSLPIILTAFGLPAQSANFHMEYVPGPGDSTRIVLVNDGQQAILAWQLSETCGKHIGHSWSSGDAFDVPGGSDPFIHGADGRLSRGIGVEPGGSWDAGSLNSCTDGMSSEKLTSVARFDGVIFADGSYEGDEAVVRALKAHRDGIVASVRSWAEVFGAANPDGSGLDQILAAIKIHEGEEKAQRDRYPFPGGIREAEDPMRGYWEGRLQVEECLLISRTNQGSQGEEPAATRLKRIVHLLDEWKTKIETDPAMQKLDAEFPPIAESATAIGIVAEQH
jgi:hypothetical protein